MKRYNVTIDYGNVERWYFCDKLHREDGPAVNFDNKIKEWYLNGERHRVDGPAVEYPDGSGSWYLNGELHRLDGPAIDWPSKKEWWVDGEQLSESEFNKRVGKTSCEWNIVEVDGVKYKLIKA